MKNRKRLIVYSLLALPFVVLGIFFFTLDPIARAGFFGEFRASTAEQFGFVDEIPAVNSGADQLVQDGDAASNDDGGRRRGREGGGREGGGRQGGGRQGGGRQGGGREGGGRRGFDPAQIFADRDADGDGKLTGDEISERMRENLERIDSDNDGSVTLEEMQAGMSRQRGGNRGGGSRGGGGGRGFDPSELFSQRDVNADGKLTGDEIGDRMRENLAEIDTDGDDAISLEEMEAGMEQLRANAGGRRRGADGSQRGEAGRRPQRPE